jgi:hypothetical protein
MQGYRELGAVAMADVVQNRRELWRTCGMLLSWRIQGVLGGADVEIFVPRGTFLEAVCAQEDAGFGCWDWDGWSGGELWGKDGRRGCEKEKLVASAGCGGGQSGRHIVYSSEGNGVKMPRFGHDFDSGSPDFSGEAESADYFSKECGFFVLGFGQGDLNLRVKQGDWQPWKACS